MSDKLSTMKKGFELWKKLAMTRMGISMVGVAEDKREALDVLLETAFESGFSYGGATAASELMSDLKEAVTNGDKKNGAIVLGEHGHA